MNLYHKIIFLTAIFLAGAAVLIVEIIGARLFAPFFGATIFVWSSLITVTLGGLALGYFIGGYMAEKKSSNVIFYYLLAVCGALLMLIVPLANPVTSTTDSLGLRLGPLVAACALFFPFFTAAGLLSPIALKIYAKENTIGGAAGFLYGLSTLGSLCGALLAGFILIPILHISTILEFSAAGLLTAAGIGLVFEGISWIKIFALFFVFLVSTIWTVTKPTGQRPKSLLNFNVIYAEETFYSSIKIVEGGGFRCLISDVALHSCIDKTGTMNFTQLVGLGVTPFLRPLSPRDSVLFLGSGAGAMLSSLPQGPQLSMVEIDPTIIEIGKKYFGFDHLPAPYVYNDDARHALKVLREQNASYDLIVMDVFSGITLPAHVFTTEAFRDLSRLLKSGGLIIINGGLIKNNDGVNDPLITAIFKTAQTSFSHIKVFMTGELPEQNIIFYLSEKKIPDMPLLEVVPNIDKKTPILTDDFYALDYYNLETALAVIVENKKFLGDILKP